MKRSLLTVLLSITAFATVTTAQDSSADRTVTVMTRNVYGGVDAEIFAIPSSTDFPDLVQKVAAVYQGYFTRRFPERAAAIAAEIQATRPDLIGIQEALLVRTQYPPDGPATAATEVVLDYVQILLDALAAKGLHYEVVAQTTGFDAELPSALGFDVRHTDREIILARTDLNAADMKLWNAQGGNFLTNCTIPGGVVGPILIRRAWSSIDAKVRGKSFRFVTTHLDNECLPFTSAVQEAQAAELIAGPGSTALPILFAGDFNSPAETGATYSRILNAGFQDVWTTAIGSGPTCCQDSDLLNGPSLLDERIDFVFFRGNWKVIGAANVGQNPESRTFSGLWPSDHAGVVTTLSLPSDGSAPR